jgi:hypothetical protein
MSEFLKLAYELLASIFLNLIGFFATLFKSVIKLFSTDIVQYVKIIGAYVSDFGIVGWILTILLVAILLGIFGIIVFFIARTIVRRHRKKSQEFDQDELLGEIGALNRQVVELINEKNQIMAMQVSQLGLSPGDSLEAYAEKVEEAKGKNGEKGKDGSNGEHRFTKLDLVDERYSDFVEPAYNDSITLEDLCVRYRNYAASKLGLYYKPEVVRLYIAGMAASRILILEGISGTGKTSLPYSFGKFLGNFATLVSVQPSYRDKTELLGYFNEFTKRFNETEFLRAVYEAGYRREPSFIVLDEMNLARIEYYFAEMLSVLEMPTPEEWLVDLVPTGWDSDPKLLQDGKLRISTTLWFVGTANNDDSTFTITDKVYDRAIAIELNEKAEAFEAPDTEPISITTDHLSAMFNEAKDLYPISEQMRSRIYKLDGYLLTRFKMSFGNRISKQIDDFVPVYVACGGTEMEAVDFLVCRKILKKFESMNIPYVKDEIKELILFIEKTFGKTGLPESRKYLLKIQNLF